MPSSSSPPPPSLRTVDSMMSPPQRRSGCLGDFMRDAWREWVGIPFRDDHFTEADWQRHLSWRRYVPEPRVLVIVVVSLAPVWGWSVVVSVFVGCWATWAEPAGAPVISAAPQLLTPFTITSFALSLLLLFKTNSSYARWWEARTLLGRAFVLVRSVMRVCLAYMRDDGDGGGRGCCDDSTTWAVDDGGGGDRDHGGGGNRRSGSRPRDLNGGSGRTSFQQQQHQKQPPPAVPLQDAVFRWVSAYMPALSAYLRGHAHYLDEHLGGVLLPHELEWLRARLRRRGGNPPLAVLHVLSRLVARARLRDEPRRQVEDLLTELDLIVGGCERIWRQAMPYAYNRHNQRFLLVYLTFLPVAMWPAFQWATPAVAAIVAFLLCGVENVGVQIEEPFRVLPLNQISAATLNGIRQVLADRDAAGDMARAAAAAVVVAEGSCSDDAGNADDDNAGDVAARRNSGSAAAAAGAGVALKPVGAPRGQRIAAAAEAPGGDVDVDAPWV